MTARKARLNALDAMAWRTDIPWPQDHEPLLHVVDEGDVPVVLDRLKKLGIKTTGKDKAALEALLKDDATIARLATPLKGAASLALALVAQHPAGMDRDHLLFELQLLLDDDKRMAEIAVVALPELAVVITAGGRRGDRFRVLPTIRPALAAATAPWLDALERKGAAAGTGDVVGMRFRTNPAHAMALLLAWLGQNPPRLRTASTGADLHAKDSARVLEAVHNVVERTTIPLLLTLCVRAGLARPAGPRLSLSTEAPQILSEEPAVLWKRMLLLSVPPRAFAAVLRLAQEVEPGFVPEATLRRAIKTLHHTEQIVTGHPFPADGRSNEAGARSELDHLRNNPLLEQGRTPDGVPALRLHPMVAAALRGFTTEPEPHHADGHVGADHELHVGPSAPPHLIAALGFFAAPEVLDTVSRFRVTSASVAAGAARGVTAGQMEQVLEFLSSRGVPDNVKRSLRDFGAARGRATFGRGLVVAFGSEADARKAMDDEELRGLLGDALTQSVFLVDSAKEQKVRTRLVALGLAVAEDTLMYAPPPAARELDDDDGDGDQALGTKVSAHRTATLGTALVEAAQRKEPPKMVPPALLHALTGQPALGSKTAGATATSEVIPLRAKKTAGTMLSTVSTSSGPQGQLEDALRTGRTVRLQYMPESGGGSETMTVDVLEVFERGGNVMARVRFPNNPRAADRVLRTSRVQWVEPALKKGEQGS